MSFPPEVVRYDLVDGGVLPVRGSKDATGYDLTAVAIKKETDQYIMYDTGIRLQPYHDDIDLQIRPRSSIYKTGMVLTNSIGTIDVDYSGNLYVTFYKVFGEGSTPYVVGDRIAQLVCATFCTIDFKLEPFIETERGDGGFGSTGK